MKFIIATIFTLIFSFLVNSQIIFADEIVNPNQLNKDTLESTENIQDNEKSSKIKQQEGDIFGDEQTFPFVAGLGKNAAH